MIICSDLQIIKRDDKYFITPNHLSVGLTLTEVKAECRWFLLIRKETLDEVIRNLNYLDNGIAYLNNKKYIITKEIA